MLPNASRNNTNLFTNMAAEELVEEIINDDATQRVIELVQGWLQTQKSSSSVSENGQRAQVDDDDDDKRPKNDVIVQNSLNNDSFREDPSTSNRKRRLEFLGSDAVAKFVEKYQTIASNSNPGGQNRMATQPSEHPPQSIYHFTLKDAKGNDVNLSEYKGKVLLIVNVASKCGMTNSNYEELNLLYQKYKDQGLEILAFPCNQFGDEEPGSNNEIQDFVCTRFKSAFPIFDKIEVNGENVAPLYKFLKLGKWGIFGDDIQWNFAKFLVDKSGHPVGRYYPTTSPLSLEYDIKKLLEIA